MSTSDTDIRGYASLGSDVNKQKGGEGDEKAQGAVSTKLPELSLDMQDSEIIKLTEKWKKDWEDSPKKQEWEKQIAENEKYWLGKHYDMPKNADGERPTMDNLIFESMETYLPEATRRNPEPIVELDPSEVDESGNTRNPKGTDYVTKVKKKLADVADKNKMRLKLKRVGRFSSIYQLGVGKLGWDLDKDIPTVRIIRPHKIILDPDATIEEDGYTGDRIGEVRKLQASKILSLIEEGGSEDAKKKIQDIAKENLGTQIQFVEWWTPQYFCWTLDKVVLLKRKNPHWNYDGTENQTSVDDYGNETVTEAEKKGLNHFPSPKMPYEFLSVFSIGDRPMDPTSLIHQNLSNQDQINKRNSQIDKNADDMNGGIVVSLARSGLTAPQAKGVTKALRKGGAVVIPDGVPREAIDRYPAPGLPPDVYNDLNDKRNRLRDIFGVRGSSAAGLTSEDTVRGKILNKSSDTDRIGGGISEYLEQFSDGVYNWFVQLLYVYDTGFQFIDGAVPPKVTVSVKEGSLLPKDSTSIANQALDLAKMNRISNIDLYKRLEYPNPEELAANVWLETNAPELLYKENPLVQQAIMMRQQAAQAEAMAKDDAETKKMVMKGEMDMEKELIKEGKKKGEGRSVLSEVPANTNQGP